MGLFDRIKPSSSSDSASKPTPTPETRVVFDRLPETVEDFLALPQMSLEKPAYAAALFLLAMVAYPADRDAAVRMVNALKGPQTLSPFELQFLSDRMSGADYKPRSFFVGATPENDYTPTEPYTVIVRENPYTYAQEGYAVVLLQSGGADNPRQFKLRRKGNQWFMWEQFLLSDIRPPKSSDPWA